MGVQRLRPVAPGSAGGEKTLILVTGQHRSGTSATAGCLKHLGVELGQHLMPPAHDNPKGFFEDVRVVQVHDALLAKLGASWDRPRAIPAGWMEEPATKTAEAHLRGLLLGFGLVADTFAIKDPRAVLFIPMWQRVCDFTGARLTVLTPERKVEAIVSSLEARHPDWPQDQALDLVRAYGNALEKMDPGIPTASIGFPDGLWQASCWERVGHALGVELDITRIGAVHSFLDGGLVHHG